MDDPKARGLKHLKNKKKYGKPKHIVAVAKTKSVPVLGSNWDRYEQEEEQTTIDSSTDFAILANAPIARGNHFLFKSDKELERDFDPKLFKPSQLFNLDLNMLNKSIATVPFNVRSGVDESYFTENQIKIFEKSAENAGDVYKDYLEESDLAKSRLGVFDEARSDGESSEESENEEASPAGVESVEELPQISSINISGDYCSKKNVRSTSKEEDSDLEKWLDDVLDDYVQ